MKDDRQAAEDRLTEHWVDVKASYEELAAEIAGATGRPVPPEAEDGDALAHLTDDEVMAVHALVCGSCELDGGGVDHHQTSVEGDMTTDIYCTSYCNHGHRTSDGAPVGHECYVLPPEAIRLEREGDVPGAISEIEAARPLRAHRGARRS